MNNDFIQDNLLGPAAPDLGWVPAPRYLLRRARILTQLRKLPASELLEIGPGAGMLMQELSAMGFSCHALETSSPARQLIQNLSTRYGHSIDLHDAPEVDWQQRFPLVMAFEVLEHIEDDRAALRQWVSWLKPGGFLLISVPAHQHRWNARDVWAGHVRRYERAELVSKIEQDGLEVKSVECYGFPLANFLEWAGDRRYQTSMKEPSNASTRDSNTANSGVDRSRDAAWYPLLMSLPGKIAMQSAICLQVPFLHTEIGNGYLVCARKSA